MDNGERPVKNLSSIRVKLALLAGVPVLGAVLLSLLVVQDARRQAQKAEALGSVESLAQLSASMSIVLGELQMERAQLARYRGTRAAGQASRDSAEAPGSGDTAPAAPAAPTAALREQFQRTDVALAEFNAFLERRDISKLPARLADDLQAARTHLRGLATFRQHAETSPVELRDVLRFYRLATRSLIEATAALTELSDDGELLRVITSLVAALEIAERASQEHAVLSNVFAAGEFPPGSYRTLVTTITEEDAYVDVFRTSASTAQIQLYDSQLAGNASGEAAKMREAALESTEDELTISPDVWFDVQQQKVHALGEIVQELNHRVERVAVVKMAATRQAVLVGSGLAGGVLVVSVLLAWLVARGVSRNVEHLQDASRRVANGDLETRVQVRSRDELGALGRTFNRMIAELARARAVLSEQARMTRELEIAATIQQSLLPSDPRHPEFEFAGRMIPADEVGGDFYDVLRERGGEAMWITIGDVSGHGLGAGLVMLMAQSAFAAQFRANSAASPDGVLRGVNDLLCENVGERLKENKYVTAQLLEYQGAGRFACAGAHEWPVVFRVGSADCEVVETPGPWLGIDSDLADVPVISIQLEVGDILCLYSDGVTEARNQAGELFDVPRLQLALTAAAQDCSSLDDIADRILAAVSEHADRRDDDWTLLLVRRVRVR